MQSLRRAVMFLALALPVLDAWSQDVGRVQFVSGRVEVERGTQRLALQVGSQVQQGDTVLSGADGHLQLVMSDSAYISVRPNSRMRIDAYTFDATKPGAGRALLSLLTGAMHAFTGQIVARDRESFKMKTPLATVGIRGSGNILAHLEETGTINHTLTGAHSVTSLDGFGIERTLVSYPGQTVQVRPGQPLPPPWGRRSSPRNPRPTASSRPCSVFSVRFPAAASKACSGSRRSREGAAWSSTPRAAWCRSRTQRWEHSSPARDKCRRDTRPQRTRGPSRSGVAIITTPSALRTAASSSAAGPGARWASPIAREAGHSISVRAAFPTTS